MELLFTICAIVGGTVIVCQFLMTLLGLGGDHHDGGGAGGHDVAGHDAGGADGHDAVDAHTHDAGHDGAASWFASMLTFRTVTAAVAFFGIAGLIAHPHYAEAATLGIAIGAGAAAFFLVGWLMKNLGKLNVDGTLRIDRAVGATGTVYLTVPGERSGVGRVTVNVHQRTVEYKAITSQQSLPTGSKIRVVAIAAADTLEVAGVEQSATAANSLSS